MPSPKKLKKSDPELFRELLDDSLTIGKPHKTWSTADLVMKRIAGNVLTMQGYGVVIHTGHRGYDFAPKMHVLMSEIVATGRKELRHHGRELDVDTMADLFTRKNTDYGSAFRLCGFVGVLVRMLDKAQRLRSLKKSGVQLVLDESSLDSLVDMINYAVIARLVITA